MRLKSISIGLLFSWIAFGVAHAASVAPNFAVAIRPYGGGRLEIVATPPEKHHFNVYAPMSIEDLDKKTHQKPMQVKDHSIQFLIGRGSGARNLAVTIYLCDDANTYCEKHRVVSRYPADGASNEKAAIDSVAAVSPPDVLAKKSKGEKPLSAFQISSHGVIRYVRTDVHGFIDNDPEGAFTKAKTDGRPILISFYGIWCPACNLLEEQVFSSAEFKSTTSGMIRLKMDVDAETSWLLKSQYKVGSYPTIVVVTPSGEEISRVVGFRSKSEYLENLRAAWEARNEPSSKLKQKADSGDVAATKRLGLVELSRQDYKNALEHLKKAQTLQMQATQPQLAQTAAAAQPIAPNASVAPSTPVDETLQVAIYNAEIGLLEDNGGDPAKARSLLEKAVSEFSQSVAALDWHEKLAKIYESQNASKKRDAELKALVTLGKSVTEHPEKLVGSDYAPADVYEMMARAYDSLSIRKLAKQTWIRAAGEYSRGKAGSRGGALERAYCLWKSGQGPKAERLYRQMEKKYPHEFTFYYGHATMLFELKYFARARELAAKALDYSYGENKLRAVDLMAKTYAALGKPDDGLSLISKTLSTVQLPADKGIRIHRYFRQLKETEEKLKNHSS